MAHAMPAPGAEPRPTSGAPAPGWYPDPWKSGRLKWWDGRRWVSRYTTREEVMQTIYQSESGTARHLAKRPPLPSWWVGLSAVLVTALLSILVLEVWQAVLAHRAHGLVAQWEGRPRRVPWLQVARADRSRAAVAEAEFWVWVGAFVALVTWLFLAHRSDAMNARALRHRSGWAIGGWFVPILSWWRPIQMVADVRRGSTGWLGGWSWAGLVLWYLFFGTGVTYSFLGAFAPMELTLHDVDSALVFSAAFTTWAGTAAFGTLLTLVLVTTTTSMVRRADRVRL